MSSTHRIRREGGADVLDAALVAGGRRYPTFTKPTAAISVSLQLYFSIRAYQTISMVGFLTSWFGI